MTDILFVSVQKLGYKHRVLDFWEEFEVVLSGGKLSQIKDINDNYETIHECYWIGLYCYTVNRERDGANEIDNS